MFRKLILIILSLSKIRANGIEDDFEIANRIVGGSRCSVADNKYMVAIIFTDSSMFLCGASLISSKWVLTARHCIKHWEEPYTYTVVAGVEVPAEESWGKDAQISIAKGCFRHPTDDIGLINLHKHIKVSRVVGYVKLATHARMMGRKLEDICSNSTVVGWGSQNMMRLELGRTDDKKTTYDPYLQCVNLPIISPLECYERLHSIARRNLSETNFCAFKKDADACLGDSGGPLMCGGVQYGIISSGYGCAYNGYPGMYVKVYYFENYIKTIIEKGNRDNSEGEGCSEVNHSFLVAIIHQRNAKSYNYLCAGSLLTRTWVLTSGSCTDKCTIPNYYTVVAGLKDPFMFDPYDKRTIWSQVEKCVQSPDHRKAHDIALMKLRNGFNPSKTVSFIRFATALDVENKMFEKVCDNGMLIGYGQPKDEQLYDLQCEPTIVTSEEDCHSKWPPNKIGNRHGCIDGFNISCYAKQGAPLICGGIQYGVLTFVPCIGHKGHVPVLIAKVDKYDVFLQETVEINDIYERTFKSSYCNLNNPVLLCTFIISLVLFLI